MGSSQSTPNETDTTEVILESDDDGEVKVSRHFCHLAAAWYRLILSTLYSFCQFHEIFISPDNIVELELSQCFRFCT